MSLIATVRRLLKHEKIPFLPDGPDTVLLGFPDPEGVFYGDLQVNEEDRVILIQMAPPLKAPQDKLMQMAEFVARANQHIVQGSLRVGFYSGLIVCKTGLILGKSHCQRDIFYHLLASNWWEIKRWFPAIKAVAMGVLSPEQATNMILSVPQPEGEHGRDDKDVLHHRWDDIQHGSMS